MTTIETLANCLDSIGLQFVATIGLDGKPKVRPMQYMVIFDNKMWFCTNSEKLVFAELQKNPWLELCGSTLEKDEMQSKWIRFSAEVVFEDNAKVRRLIIEKSPIVKQLYGENPDNPIFKVFYLKNIKGSMNNNLGHVKGLKDNNNFSKPEQFEL